MSNKWNKNSWKPKPVLQQPDWPDEKAYQSVLDHIGQLPPLVFAGEVRSLKKQIANAAQGKAFVLQAGDCAEEFSQCTAPKIRETLKIILQMAVILSYVGEKQIVKIGRVAGQYAKPRSKPTENINGLELPSFRGDIVNSSEPTLEGRRPDCERLLTAYYHSASTLNILRAFTRGGYASLNKVHSWNQAFVRSSKEGKSYEKVACEIDKALKFMDVIGFDSQSMHQLREVDFFTSHEALLLGYETALTRNDSTTGDWYDCSAHMLWIGDRTRQLDGAHVEFLSGVHNPLGMKIGPKHDIDEVKKLLEKLNPDNEWGRISLITRFGEKDVDKYLPTLVRAITKEGFNVLWSCDPMHGNTYLSASNYKTRNFSAILGEIRNFFAVHKAEGTVAGGVHFEMTGQDVTECVGGAQQIEDHHLKENYATSCDPRLNAQQSLELAFLIADNLKE